MCCPLTCEPRGRSVVVTCLPGCPPKGGIGQTRRCPGFQWRDDRGSVEPDIVIKLLRQHRLELTAGEGGDPLDLDERILADEPAYHNAGRGRAGWTPQPLGTDLGGFLVVVEAENVIGRLDDVGEAAASVLEDPRELVEDLACLQDDVARTYDVALIVRR